MGGICFSQGKIDKPASTIGTSEIGVKLPLSVLIVGVLGMVALNDTTLVDALARTRHSDGIELSILISKNPFALGMLESYIFIRKNFIHMFRMCKKSVTIPFFFVFNK